MHIPIGVLPDDVLLIVFKICAEVPRRGNTEDSTILMCVVSEQAFRRINLDFRTLLSLTHVCAHWRAVALAHSPLWTRVDGGNTEQLAAFSERSGILPLSLFFKTLDIAPPGTGHEDIAVYEFVRRYEHRLRRLDVIADAFSDPADCDAPVWIKDLNAPELECLAVALADGEWEASDLNQVLLFGESLREHHALKALALTEMSPWIPANHFPNLTHLFLSFSSCAWPVKYPPILSLFARMPNIEHIHIQCMKFIFAPCSTLVSLPQLRSLKFIECGEPEDLAPILRRMMFSPRVCVLVCKSEIWSSREVSIATAVPAAFHAEVLDIRAQNDRMGLLARTDEGGLLVDSFREPLTRSDTISVWACTALTAIQNSFVLQHLTTLTLDIPTWVADTVEKFIQRAVGIERMCLLLAEKELTSADDEEQMAENSKVKRICDVLSRDLPDSGIVCPALHTIQFASLVWLPSNCNFIRFFVEQCKTMLAARADRGFPIQRLEVQFINASLEREQPWRAGEDAEPLSELSAFISNFVVIRPQETFPKFLVIPEVWNKQLDGDEVYWEGGDD